MKLFLVHGSNQFNRQLHGRRLAEEFHVGNDTKRIGQRSVLVKRASRQSVDIAVDAGREPRIPREALGLEPKDAPKFASPIAPPHTFSFLKKTESDDRNVACRVSDRIFESFVAGDDHLPVAPAECKSERI